MSFEQKIDENAVVLVLEGGDQVRARCVRSVADDGRVWRSMSALAVIDGAHVGSGQIIDRLRQTGL